MKRVLLALVALGAFGFAAPDSAKADHWGHGHEHHGGYCGPSHGYRGTYYRYPTAYRYPSTRVVVGAPVYDYYAPYPAVGLGFATPNFSFFYSR